MRTTFVLLVGGTLLLTGATGRPSAQTIFRGGIDLVEADAVVVDAQGRPVTSLTAADFTLSVDGQPRAIESVEYVDAAAAPAPGADEAASAPARGRRPAVRHVIFVADEGNMSAGGGRAAVKAAQRLLDRFSPSDRLALLSIPSGPAVDFTADHETIRAALDRVVGRASPASGGDDFGLNLQDLFAFDVGATRDDRTTQQAVLVRECPLSMPDGRRESCEDSLRAEAQTRLDAIRERSRATVTGPDKLFRSLGTMAGPKIVILVSEGLLMRPDHRDEGGIDSLGTQAALAGVTLYSMLLDSPVVDVAVSGDRQRTPSSSGTLDRVFEEDGLRALSAASGGMLIRASAAPDAAFQRLANALSGFYVVAFRVLPSDREGAHQIRLVSTKTASSTHSRSHFVMTPLARPASAANGSAVAAPRHRDAFSSVTIDKVTLRVATRSIADADGTVRILFSVDVQEPAAHSISALALGYKLTAGDRLVADTGRVVPVTHTADGAAEPISYIAFRGVPPGRYKLELSASDGTKHNGFVAHPVEAALHPIGVYRLSDLLLASSAPSGEGPFPVPANFVIRGSELVAGVEVSASDASAFADAAIRFEVISPQNSSPLSFRVVPLSANGAASQFVRATLPVPAGESNECLARASVFVKGVSIGQIEVPFRTTK